jgi:hypothetical protein
MKFYILDANRQPMTTDDAQEWGMWFSDFDRRRVAESFVGNVRISTVFLGIDHRFYGKGPPLIFETMVFGATDDGGDEMIRTSTWDEAEIAHKAMTAKIQARQDRIDALAPASTPKDKRP